jgi:hypothetical protein
MPLQRLVIANMKTGYETDRTPFLIDNDAFPVLNNAYIWRGRIPRKRGTSLLGRLQRNLTAQALGNTSGAGALSGNIFSILGISATQPSAAIVEGSISLVIGADTFTEPVTPNGTLSGSSGGSGTINYNTGAFTITGAPATTAAVLSFSYYPVLPVMGLQDFEIGTINQPLLISFDTRYSYGFSQGGNIFYDVTFYKSTGVAFHWNGQNYQQFYSTNYLGINTIADSADKSGCMWATNGNPAFHFITITNVVLAGAGTSGAVSTITTSAPHNLTNNDYVFINEVNGITNGAPTGTFGGINGASGQVTVTGATTFTLPTPYAAGAYVSGGIVQYMTRSSSPTLDGIRWYDGDPTVSANFGWVNFAPPLNQYDSTTNPHPFYLVGADIITPFKNRLIFSGVYLTTTQVGASIQYFPNRIVYSQVGTPFYSSPLPFPIATQSPSPDAWFQNVAGKGGFLTAPIDQQIIVVSPNEDVLIYGMEQAQLKLIYTLDDSLPFIFQTINSELGSQNTFSAVNLDTGILSIGDYGIILTTQVSAQRIDLQIPDQVFDISVSNNNVYRVTSIRDYRNEWIYFTYCPGDQPSKVYNSKTLLYNYRDNNWATFDENFTKYGTFRRTTNRTWASLGSIYGTWSNWTDPWNFGANQAFFPQIVGGNQHGFVLIKGEGTQEGVSQLITAINISTFTFTSPNHGLQTGDFIQVSNLLGITIQDFSGNPLTIFQITVATANTFVINSNVPFTISGTYVGGGVYKILSIPFIQTKQFPLYWSAGRGARVGLQRYLFETTPSGKITAFVYSSQNPDTPSNDPGINPYLIYEDVILTSAEPNLYGTNPAYSAGQSQIWHRSSNSFNGDTIQLGFTLSTAQMFDETINSQEIILHAIAIDLYPGATLA